MKEVTNELFILPVGLKPVVYIDNQPLYGSQKINEKYIDALSKDSRIKNADKFVNLIDEKQIVPCYFTKGVLNFFLWRTFAPLDSKSIMAFYEPAKTKKIYMILTNQANIIGYSSNKILTEITVHECMHMAADKKTSMFLSMFSNELINYYKIYFSKIFNCNIKELKDDSIHRILIFIFNTFEKESGRFAQSDLVKYYRMLEKELRPFSKLDKEQFEKIISSLIVTINLAFSKFETFYYNYNKFSQIINPLYLAYKEVFSMKNLSTLCYQELIYPSEVIAIYSEKKMDKPLKAINLL